MPKAILLLHRKRFFPDGTITEVKVWQVDAPVRGSGHGLKCSLFYGRKGERLVGYDNEAGKGDHRHYGMREEPYAFTTFGQALADFLADVRRLRREQA